MKKNKFTSFIGFLAIAFLTSVAVGQTKQLPASNLENQFQNNKILNPTTALSGNGNNKNQEKRPKIENLNGSFSANIEKMGLQKEEVVKNLNLWFGLNENFTHKQVSEKTDELRITHTNFEQYFKGFLIEGELLMLHSDKGLTKHINGHSVQFSDLNTEIRISSDQAKNIAKNYLKVNSLINEYPVKTVIIKVSNNGREIEKLAHKVRIDSSDLLTMCYVYIDTQTGEVLNKISLIAHSDIDGTAQTLYSGNQAITCDNNSGTYRLRDNARNIQTLDATNATSITSDGYLTGSVDFTSTSTAWLGPKLTSFTISSIAQGWWTSTQPNLYIKIKDSAGKLVYTSTIQSNTNPPVTFDNLNILLTNAPYTVEIWNYNSGTSPNFGGSYTISTDIGTQDWSGNGNNGNYTIVSTGKPELDVHWAMEKTYDFYKNIYNRDNYDGNGSLISQYVNPKKLYSVNNSQAYPSPYNFIEYGLGDGTTMRPIVGIQITGHEFTHKVIEFNGNGGLTYQGESGALNESFADIMGTCVDFYAGTNPNWIIGEDFMIKAPLLRSMSNPNDGNQPDTYKGQLWIDTSSSTDHGGVHTNSGVQNFWFYLLSQGGSGTNDIGNAYNVEGIGINQARDITFRSLMNYISPNATYSDAYYGSLQAAQDLFGNTSSQYNAVMQAWYAVGVGNNPNGFCSGTTNLTASSGTITDGSESLDYGNNADCKWVIAPTGVSQIALNFTEFNTESNSDIVTVYDGPDENSPVLATLSGNNLPGTIQTSKGVGTMCIKFTSNSAVTNSGWSANYTSTNLGIKDFNINQSVSIYPNPANNQFKIIYDNPSDSINEISVYDITGKKVHNISGINIQEISLDVSYLEKGLYMVEIVTQNQNKAVKKLILE